MSIPKVFHQIWLGSEMPVVYKTLRDRILSLHPSWTYKLWTEANLPSLVNQKLYDHHGRLFYKADILRYEILAHEGGVYLDTDYLLYKNIEPLLVNTDHFLAYEDRDWVCNSIMGFAPNHWFMWKVINDLSKRCALYPNRWGVDRVGPGLITATAQAFPQMLVLPRNIFYPIAAQDVKTKQYEVFPYSYGAHLWSDYNGRDCIQVHKTFEEYKKYAQTDNDDLKSPKSAGIVEKTVSTFLDQRPGIVNREYQPPAF